MSKNVSAENESHLLNSFLVLICSLIKIEVVTVIVIIVGSEIRYLGAFLSELFGQEGESNCIRHWKQLQQHVNVTNISSTIGCDVPQPTPRI